MEFPSENFRHGGGDVPKLEADGDGKGHPKIPKSTVPCSESADEPRQQRPSSKGIFPSLLCPGNDKNMLVNLLSLLLHLSDIVVRGWSSVPTLG